MTYSAFSRTFGNLDTVKVLDFLIENPVNGHSKTEIANNCGLPYDSVEKIWPLLVKRDMVRITGIDDEGAYYSLNMKSDIVRKLFELDIAMSKKGNIRMPA